MSADLLRRAAVKLREHATAASFGTAGWVVDPRDGDVTTVDGGWMVADTMELNAERPDASYIALMHPPVALALADHLDERAAAISDAMRGWNRDPTFIDEHLGGVEQLAADTFAVVIKLARSILREPAEGGAG